MRSIEFNLFRNKKKESVVPVSQESVSRDPQELLLLAQRESVEIVISPEDRDIDGDLTAFPGGPKSNLSEQYWKLVRTPAFKKWFGDSEIVDQNGEPALVYHTTNYSLEGFNKFSDDKAAEGREENSKTISHGDVEKGFYFTAGKYEYGKNRISVFINSKPKIIEKHGDIMNLKNEEVLKLEKQGYTGMVHLFKDSEAEIVDLKKEYRRKYAPRTISDKLFYGFSKLADWDQELSRMLSNNVEVDPAVQGVKGVARGALKNIKSEMRNLHKVQKDALAPFFEVCVFNPDQIMIVDKVEGGEQSMVN